MIDKDEYPQTAELEDRCVHILASLWNSPSARAAVADNLLANLERLLPDLEQTHRKRGREATSFHH
jgi:hypothetical protein